MILGKKFGEAHPGGMAGKYNLEGKEMFSSSSCNVSKNPFTALEHIRTSFGLSLLSLQPFCNISRTMA